MHSVLSPAALGVAALLCSAAASQQIFVPNRSADDPTELNTRLNYPLMRAASRSQFLFATEEVGGKAVTISRIALRYDGPSFGAGGGRLANLEIWLGNGGVAPAQSTAQFDANYTGTLTRVFAATNVSFGADDDLNPAPWGGPNGEFRFALQRPFAYSGGNLVVELRASGNTNSGPSARNALLDAEWDALVGPKSGTVQLAGQACGGSRIGVSGQLAPGSVVSCHGGGFGASSIVVNTLGAARRNLPLDALGMPGCSIYSDAVIQLASRSDASGNLAPFSPGGMWPIPANRFFSGATLHFQFWAAKPGANALGAVTTQRAEVTFGSYRAPYRGYMGHFHHFDANARIATLSAPVVLAMQLN